MTADSKQLGSKPVVLCDIDGVVANLVDEALMWLYYRYKLTMPSSAVIGYDIAYAATLYMSSPDVRNWRMQAGALPTDERLAEELNRYCFLNPAFYIGARPYMQVLAALQQLASEGHTICFLTGRPGCVRNATQLWLQQYGLTTDVACVPGKNLKTAYIEDFVDVRKGQPVVFVEDDHKALLDALQKFSAYQNFSTLLMTRPWNALARKANFAPSAPVDLAERIVSTNEALLATHVRALLEAR